MRASVLVINYNGEKYIKQCIQSLKKQTYSNLEIIFFDDCSTDKSLEEIKKFSDIKLIQNSTHTEHGSYNQIEGLKRSFQICTGDIIFFLDSDDFFHDKKIETVISEFKNNSNIEMMFDLPMIVEDGRDIDYMKNFSKSIRLSHFPFFTQQSCISIKRSFFTKIFSKISESIFPNVWVDFRIAIYSKFFFGNVFILNNYLTFYRKTPTNISSKFSYLSKSWWTRRLEYHLYLERFCNENNFAYKKNLDLFITLIVNKIIK